MKYTTAIAATLAVAQAAPVEQVCKLVTTVSYGEPTWVPYAATPTWSAWESSKTPVASKKTTTEPWSAWESAKTPVASTKKTTETWAAWETTKTPVASKKTTSSYDPSWSVWSTTTTKKTPDAASTTTYGSEWESWSTGPAVTSTSTKYEPTTAKYTTESTTESTTKSTTEYTTPYTTASTTASTTESTTEATTTSSQAAATTTAAVEPACPPASTSFQTGDQCFAVYNNAAADQGAIQAGLQDGSVTFWQKNQGTQYDTSEECDALCAGDDTCTATVYTNSPSASSADYKFCWFTTGLPRPNACGFGTLSYKVDC